MTRTRINMAVLLTCAAASAVVADALDDREKLIRSVSRRVEAEVTADHYARAEGLLRHKFRPLLKNASIVPHWIGDSDRFWYRRDTADGYEFVIVDAATDKTTPAFDHRALAQALTGALGRPVEATALPFSNLAFLEEETSVEAFGNGFGARCDLKAGSCEALPAWRLDPMQLVSPDGAMAAIYRDGNVWLRDLADGTERPLSTDGEPHYAYGKPSEWLPGAIPLRRLGMNPPPFGAAWSPDSCLIVLPRTDEREVGEYPFLELLPPDGSPRPRVHTKRMALVGDNNQPRYESHLFDVRSGTGYRVPLPDGCTSDIAAAASPAFWGDDSRQVFFLCHKEANSVITLYELDVETKDLRQIISEESDTYADMNHSQYFSAGPNVRVLDSGEVIWFSERDGWGHLYLLDGATGSIKRQLTRGSWMVHDIIHVDEAAGNLFFTAGGREPGRNPYYRHLYRTSLDGGEPVLLTPENATHQVTTVLDISGSGTMVSPSGRYVVDSYSRVDLPTVTVVRSLDGRKTLEVVRADAENVLAAGFRPPVEFTAKAADGETDVWGVIYLPEPLEPNRKYPVIEHIYGGPQTNLTPVTFVDAAGVTYFGGQRPAFELTNFGFILVIMDVRGTPLRSKKFHDYTYRKHHEFAIEDHVAVIRQLGERYPIMDLDRVGIYGHSWGGYASALAMLRFPDFYKVAVSSAGPYDYRYLYPVFAKWTGMPQFEDGGVVAPRVGAKPVNMKPHSELADRLAGKLFIIAGEHDENTLPSSTWALVDALIKADRDFDFLVLPNRDHNFTNEPYFIRRRWDYFVEHLLGADPPVYRMGSWSLRP